MPERLKKREKRRHSNVRRRCDNCGECTYVGDGGYWCMEHCKLVMDDFEPTEDYFVCGGKSWEQQ